MIGLIIIVVMLVVLIDLVVRARTEQAPAPQVCPPHKWYHAELRDRDGNIVAWKLICRKCGPLNMDE